MRQMSSTLLLHLAVIIVLQSGYVLSAFADNTKTCNRKDYDHEENITDLEVGGYALIKCIRGNTNMTKTNLSDYAILPEIKANSIELAVKCKNETNSLPALYYTKKDDNNNYTRNLPDTSVCVKACYFPPDNSLNMEAVVKQSEKSESTSLKCNEKSYMKATFNGTKHYINKVEEAECNEDGFFYRTFLSDKYKIFPCETGCVYNSDCGLNKRHQFDTDDSLENEFKDEYINGELYHIGATVKLDCHYSAFNNGIKEDKEHLSTYTYFSTFEGTTYATATCRKDGENKTKWAYESDDYKSVRDKICHKDAKHKICYKGCISDHYDTAVLWELAKVYKSPSPYALFKMSIRDGARGDLPCNNLYSDVPKVGVKCFKVSKTDGDLVLDKYNAKCPYCVLNSNKAKQLNINWELFYKEFRLEMTTNFKVNGETIEMGIGEKLTVPCLPQSDRKNDDLLCTNSDYKDGRNNVQLVGGCRVERCIITDKERKGFKVQISKNPLTLTIKLNDAVPIDCQYGYELRENNKVYNTTYLHCSVWPLAKLSGHECTPAYCSLNRRHLLPKMQKVNKAKALNYKLPASRVKEFSSSENQVMVTCLLGGDEYKYHCIMDDNNYAHLADIDGSCPVTCTVKGVSMMMYMALSIFILLLVSVATNFYYYYWIYNQLTHVHYANPPNISLRDHFELGRGFIDMKELLKIVSQRTVLEENSFTETTMPLDSRTVIDEYY